MGDAVTREGPTPDYRLRLPSPAFYIWATIAKERADQLGDDFEFCAASRTDLPALVKWASEARRLLANLDNDHNEMALNDVMRIDKLLSEIEE